MWHLRVNGFPTLCTMDAHGNSLHRDVASASLNVLKEFAEPIYQ